MKKLQLLFIAFLFTNTIMAQVPDVMNYQAVARNNAGAALANQTIKVRLSVVKNAVTQYSETRQVTTNALGLFNIQIGSAGALTTTGSFSGINWQNNAAPGYVLKVELDVTNSNVFTDMGSQALVTVPYSFATKTADEATETVNINGKPIDRTDVPVTGSRLKFDGSKWVSIKNDTIITRANSILAIPATSSGPTAPWLFASGSITYADLPVITVTGNETIAATFTGSFKQDNPVSSQINAAVSVCYQNISTGAITSFYESTNSFINVNIPAAQLTQVTATGAIKLPAGTYRIGLGIKNYSTTIAIAPNDRYNGIVEVRY